MIRLEKCHMAVLCSLLMLPNTRAQGCDGSYCPYDLSRGQTCWPRRYQDCHTCAASYYQCLTANNGKGRCMTAEEYKANCTIPPQSPFVPAANEETVETDLCTCSAGNCSTAGWVPYRGCWKQANTTSSDQDCRNVCSTWPRGVDWASVITKHIWDSKDAQKSDSWATDSGALEFVTGDSTHCTMVFFPKIQFGRNETLAKQVVSEALAFAKANDIGVLPVRAALTYMWGCGPGCKSSSVLVDVTSGLAKMKFALMDHFANQGFEVDRSSWGGTAHVQVTGRDQSLRLPH